MIISSSTPVTEFDTNRIAKLEPSRIAGKGFGTDKMVITFFPEVIERLIAEKTITEHIVIPGENPVPVYRFTDDPEVLITLGQCGCPACASNLDLFNAMGIKKVMFCGGGGVLDGSIEVGKLLLVDGAIRDEGFSYQYIEPSRYIYTDKALTDRLAGLLTGMNVPFLRGIVWTTDAIFRETEDRIALRRSEGAKIVEMEQSGCIAVAQFRGFDYGALIYGGDDLSGEEWSDRGWRSRNGIRFDTVELCRKLVHEM